MENVKLPSDKKMFMMLNKKNKKRVKQACCLCWSGPVVRKRTEVCFISRVSNWANVFFLSALLHRPRSAADTQCSRPRSAAGHAVQQ